MECSNYAAGPSVPFGIILVNHLPVTGISEDSSELQIISRQPFSAMANPRAVDDRLGDGIVEL